MLKHPRINLLLKGVLFLLFTATFLFSIFVIFIATQTPYLNHVIDRPPASQNLSNVVEIDTHPVIDMHSTLAKLFRIDKKDLEYVLVEDDVNFDGKPELIVFSQHRYHMTDGRVSVVRVLNILEQQASQLRLKHKLRLKGMPVSHPTIRTENLFANRAKLIILQSDAQEQPETKIQAFRLLEDRGLVQVKFHQQAKQLIQLRGKLSIDAAEGIPVAKLNHGEGLLDRDYFVWSGNHFVSRSEQPVAAPVEVERLIKSLEHRLDHEVIAIEIYPENKVLVYEQSSHNGYYHLFKFDLDYSLQEVEPIEQQAIPLEHDSYLYFKRYDGLDQSKVKNYMKKKGQFYYSPNSVIDNESTNL